MDNLQKINLYIDRFVNQLNNEGTLASWMIEAINKVPRHMFIDEYFMNGMMMKIEDITDEQLATIYSDQGLMIRCNPHSAASQPSLVFQMLSFLDIVNNNKVLEIGTGSGWNAGLLTFGSGDERLVYSIDLQDDLVAKAQIHLKSVGLSRVNLRACDGADGWPEEAPFDRIIVTVGAPDIPPAWVDQLAEGGLLLLPFRVGGIGCPLLQLRKIDQILTGRIVSLPGFMTLQGRYWDDAEDDIFSPYPYAIEQLLKDEPALVGFADTLNWNSIFFLHLAGLHMNRILPWPPKIYFPDYHAIIGLRTDQRIEIYGSHEIVQVIHDCLFKWKELGQPSITDYKLCIGRNLLLNDKQWEISRRHIKIIVKLADDDNI